LSVLLKSTSTFREKGYLTSTLFTPRCVDVSGLFPTSTSKVLAVSGTTRTAKALPRFVSRTVRRLHRRCLRAVCRWLASKQAIRGCLPALLELLSHYSVIGSEVRQLSSAMRTNAMHTHQSGIPERSSIVRCTRLHCEKVVSITFTESIYLTILVCQCNNPRTTATHRI
jgi:hypothetical protein